MTFRAIVGRMRKTCRKSTRAARLENSGLIVRRVRHASGATQARPASPLVAVAPFALEQQNVLRDTSHDVDLFALQTRAREKPPQARH